MEVATKIHRHKGMDYPLYPHKHGGGCPPEHYTVPPAWEPPSEPVAFVEGCRRTYPIWTREELSRWVSLAWLQSQAKYMTGYRFVRDRPTQVGTHRGGDGRDYPLLDQMPRGTTSPSWGDLPPGISPVAYVDEMRPYPVYSLEEILATHWVPLRALRNDAQYFMEETTVRRRRREALRAKLADTQEGCPYRTLKEAYADGWAERKLDHYGGESLRLRGHDLIRGAERAVSMTEWSRRGCDILPHQDPHAILCYHPGRTVNYAVYRDDQVTQRPIKAKP